MSAPNDDVPRSLRAWFLVHFWVDLAFAVPMFVAPLFTLRVFGWITVDPVTTRLVAAALLAIGGRSLLMRNAGVEAYRQMLGLKVIWSLAALAGLVLSAMQGAPLMTWAFVGIFAVFSIAWVHFWLRLRS